MVSTSFEVHPIDSLWSIAQIIIGFGTVACMCFVLFLGLKLKWFRAQFKVQDMPKNKKTSDSVQGIGFKMKSNSEEFQQYKAISEFATSTNLPKSTNNKNYSSNGSYADIPKKENITIEVKTNKIVEAKNRNEESKLENLNIYSSVPIHESKESLFTFAKEDEKSKQTIRETQSDSTTQESKEILVDEKYKKESETVKKKSKVSFAENKIGTVENNFEENIDTQQYDSQIRNPITVQNTVMPQEDEDHWKIRIVDEKPKVQIDNRNDDTYYEEIHLANNNSNSNSMYSSQAASIFFVSNEEKAPPDSPPPPIPRKFLEDDDNISMSSQTSA